MVLIEGFCNQNKVFKKFSPHVLERLIMNSNFKSYIHHIESISAHPACAVGLLQLHTTLGMKTSVKDSNVIQSQKSAFKNIIAIYVFSIDPPSKIDQQFLKYLFKK